LILLSINSTIVERTSIFTRDLLEQNRISTISLGPAENLYLCRETTVSQSTIWLTARKEIVGLVNGARGITRGAQ